MYVVCVLTCPEYMCSLTSGRDSKTVLYLPNTNLPTSLHNPARRTEIEGLKLLYRD